MEVRAMPEEKAQMTTNTEKDGTEFLETKIAEMKGIPTKDQLLKILQENVVEVTFTKLDGEQRIMPCTLIPEYLPPAKKDEPITQKKVRETSDKVVVAWATESKGFRSFRYDRVEKVVILDKEGIDNKA
jgi:hypothetical protein